MTAEVIEALVAKLAASPTYAEDMDRRDVASHTPRAETMDRVLDAARRAVRRAGRAGWRRTGSAPTSRPRCGRACGTERQRAGAGRSPRPLLLVAVHGGVGLAQQLLGGAGRTPGRARRRRRWCRPSTSVPSSRKGSAKQSVDPVGEAAGVRRRRPGRAG